MCNLRERKKALSTLKHYSPNLCVHAITNLYKLTCSIHVKAVSPFTRLHCLSTNVSNQFSTSPLTRMRLRDGCIKHSRYFSIGPCSD